MTPQTQTAAGRAEGLEADEIRVEAESVSVAIAPASPEVETLVARAKDGDRQAFAALYRTYLPNVYKFLYYRLNNKSQVEDMTAEVFLRALRKIGDFTWTGADFGAWLLRIARNLILDEAKSSRAKLEHLAEEMPEDSSGQAETAEDAVIERFNQSAVRDAIKTLRPDQRDVVTLRFLQGLSVPEVAQLMDKKEGTIRTLQFRGLKALEKVLVSRGVLEGRGTCSAVAGGVRRGASGRKQSRTESEAARYGWKDGER